MNVENNIPLLSIIVPVYNVEKYLSRCIDSIIKQEFENFELILVDDGSSDGSGKICDLYAKQDARIKVIHKKNQGLGAARNSGLKISKGIYIGFVDSDDWITTDMYSFLIKNAFNYKSDIVASSYILTKGNSNIKEKKYFIKELEGDYKLIYYLEYGMKYRVADYSVCNKIYKRELFEEIKFPENQLYEDGATNFKLIKKANKYVKSNKITYYYFQDSKSITRNGFKNKDFDILTVSKEMVKLANEEKNEKLVTLAKMKEARAYFSMLSKIAVYGFEDDCCNKLDIINELTTKLRKNFLLLLKSPMPINRKIVMFLLCINYKIISVPLNIYKSRG